MFDRSARTEFRGDPAARPALPALLKDRDPRRAPQRYLTYFDLTRTNIQTPTGIPNVFDVSGEVTNRGVELDVNGALTDYWRLIGSFSYIDSEITKDRDSAGGPRNQGNRLVNVPRYSGACGRLTTSAHSGGRE